MAALATQETVVTTAATTTDLREIHTAIIDVMDIVQIVDATATVMGTDTTGTEGTETVEIETGIGIGIRTATDEMIDMEDQGTIAIQTEVVAAVEEAQSAKQRVLVKLYLKELSQLLNADGRLVCGT